MCDGESLCVMGEPVYDVGGGLGVLTPPEQESLCVMGEGVLGEC